MVRGQVRIWSGVRLGYGQGSGSDMVRGQVWIWSGVRFGYVSLDLSFTHPRYSCTKWCSLFGKRRGNRRGGGNG